MWGSPGLSRNGNFPSKPREALRLNLRPMFVDVLFSVLNTTRPPKNTQTTACPRGPCQTPRLGAPNEYHMSRVEVREISASRGSDVG